MSFTEKIEIIGDGPIREALQMVGQWPVLDRNWDPSKTHYIKRTTIASPAAGQPASTKSTTAPKDQLMELNIENLLGKIRGDYNQPIIIEQYVGPDDRNSSHNIVQFDQTSFGLPSREYFLKEGVNKEKDAYLQLMVDIAELLGAERDYALEQMAKVVEFETELANVSPSVCWCNVAPANALYIATLAGFNARGRPTRYQRHLQQKDHS